MKTDSLFYALFQSLPSLLFELLGQSADAAIGYQFASVELKQTAFRIDGVFLPLANAPTVPVYFLEVQFQRDRLLYRRLFSEIFLYLRQYTAVNHWQAVVLYPSAAVEVTDLDPFRELYDCPRVQVIYLDQLGAIADLSPGLGILRLLVEPESTVPVVARGLIQRVQASALPVADIPKLLELIETIVVYTLPHCSRQEIAVMLGLTDLKATRVYQEALEEGRQEGIQVGAEREKILILRLLTRKFGTLPEAIETQVSHCSLETLEALGEVLFDLAEVADLEAWLAQSHEGS